MIRAEVCVTLKRDVMDPQGTAIGQALGNLGHQGIKSVRAGRFFEVLVEGDDPEKAKKDVEKMCDELLANTVIETYRIQVQKA